MRSRTRLGLFAVGLVLLAGLLVVGIRVAVPRTRPAFPPPDLTKVGHSRTLRTGKVIWVISEHVYTPSEAGSTPELVIYYRTNLDWHDQKRWAREVQKIWPDYVPEAERARCSEIVIWPTSPEAVVGSFGAVGIAGSFSVTKDASGKWACAICDMWGKAAAAK